MMNVSVYCLPTAHFPNSPNAPVDLACTVDVSLSGQQLAAVSYQRCPIRPYGPCHASQAVGHGWLHTLTLIDWLTDGHTSDCPLCQCQLWFHWQSQRQRHRRSSRCLLGFRAAAGLLHVNASVELLNQCEPFEEQQYHSTELDCCHRQ